VIRAASHLIRDVSAAFIFLGCGAFLWIATG